MKLINLNRIASLFALAAFATATPRVNADTVAPVPYAAHAYMVSAYASQAKDYSEFVWAYGDWQYNCGYVCMSHNGVWHYGSMITQQYVNATTVDATFFDDATGELMTLELKTDGAAPTAAFTEGGSAFTDTLIPVGAGALYIQ